MKNRRLRVPNKSVILSEAKNLRAEGLRMTEVLLGALSQHKEGKHSASLSSLTTVRIKKLVVT